MKTLQIKQLSPNATLPTRNYRTDAGLDIYAAETVILRPQEKYKLRTGIAVDIPSGYVGFLMSRSGVSSKTELVITTGVIDSGYVGEMLVNLKNDSLTADIHLQNNKNGLLMTHKYYLYDVKGNKIKDEEYKGFQKGRHYRISEGDKVAQLVITPIVTPQLEIVDQFDTQSERGEKGFGSSDEVHR